MTSDKTSAKKNMKAILVHDFVSDYESLEKTMTLSSEVEVPQPKKDQILIRTMACSISPGDIIMVQGNLIFLHPEKFPFVPGMDVCGVVENPNGHTGFQKGDIVVASNGVSPVGGMAEYMAVSAFEA
eukprot:190824-Ditylum_brightwellii.AAC.1